MGTASGSIERTSGFVAARVTKLSSSTPQDKNKDKTQDKHNEVAKVMHKSELSRDKEEDAEKRLERAFFDHHGLDECDRIPVSVPQIFAFARGRRRVIDRIGRGNLRALCSRPRWPMAADLRRQRRDGSLSQRLRLDRTAFHEGAGPESDGADANRGSIQGRATGRPGAFRRAWRFRGKEIYQRASP